MNLCRCCNALYLILFHWELTRLSLYPVVLSLIGWSRTDWNLINLPNGFDCCGIPIVCSECVLERQNSLEQIWTIPYMLWRLFSSAQLIDKNIEVFLHLLEVSFKVQPAWADSVMENGSFFVQVLFYVYKRAGSSCLTPSALLLLPPRQGKVIFHEQFSFAALLFHHGFNPQPWYCWHALLLRLYYV